MASTLTAHQRCASMATGCSPRLPSRASPTIVRPQSQRSATATHAAASSSASSAPPAPPKEVLARAISNLVADSVAKQAAADALTALLKEKEELQAANKALKRQNEQLLMSMSASAARVVEVVFPSRELPSRLFFKTSFFDGKAQQIQAGSGSGTGFGDLVSKLVNFLVYDVLAAGVLYYAAWLITGSAPTLTPQFIGIAVAVALLLPAISSAVSASRTATA